MIKKKQNRKELLNKPNMARKHYQRAEKERFSKIPDHTIRI